MDFGYLKTLIEGLLFASSEPLALSKISQIFEVKEEEAKEALKNLQNDLEEKSRGIKLINKDDKWLLTTSEKVSPYLIKLKQDIFEGDLSRASRDTLAIIAYLGPISRAKINEIRGVDSSYTLHQLLLRGLIEREPDPQRVNAFVYKISFDFLKYLGIKNVNELPQYEEFKQKNK
ncbi:MAG: SMC-Scp complex subunit ScpB [Minisyncoccia bacterium]